MVITVGFTLVLGSVPAALLRLCCIVGRIISILFGFIAALVSAFLVQRTAFYCHFRSAFVALVRCRNLEINQGAKARGSSAVEVTRNGRGQVTMRVVARVSPPLPTAD